MTREASRSGRVLQPVEQRADVLHRVLAQPAVVELGEGLAEAGRAAHVREQDRDAELVDQEVVAAEEGRPRLALGAAVDVDHHRPRAGEARRRLVQQAGDRATVEALPAHDLRLGEGGGVESAGLALGPALDALLRRSRPSRRPTGERADDSDRPSSRPDSCHARLFTTPTGSCGTGKALPESGIDPVQHARAVLVGDERDAAAVGSDVERLRRPTSGRSSGSGARRSRDRRRRGA